MNIAKFSEHDFKDDDVKKCAVCGDTATNVFFQRKDTHSNQVNELYVCDEHLCIFEEVKRNEHVKNAVL